MNYSKIGTRYAKALLKVAVEKNCLEDVMKDVRLLDSVSRSATELNQIFASPVIKPSQKISLIDTVFAKYITPLMMDFIRMLIFHRRENRLDDIIRNFFTQYRQHHNIVSATLISSVEAGTDVIKKVTELLKTKYRKTIDLSLKEDPSIIGGFILRVEDMQYDCSIRNSLLKIKQELINTPIENN